MKITTIEQAHALPLGSSGGLLCYSFERTLANGDKIIEDVPMKLDGAPLDGDSIAFFSDTDGTMMTVVSTENGFVKRPHRI